MYLMHKYWARKPHNVVGEYIKAYSEENEVVLDPFCGSGVTLIEAMRYKRKAIAVDLDPVGTFITKMTVMPVDTNELTESFNYIKDSIERKVQRLYLTLCPNCKQETPYHPHTILCLVYYHRCQNEIAA